MNALQPTPNLADRLFLAKISDFDVCLRDDRRGDTLQINVTGGGYEFSGCGAGGARLLGMGQVRRVKDLVLLNDRGVFVLYNTRVNTGVAVIVVPGVGVLTINDQNRTGNTCTCE